MSMGTAISRKGGIYGGSHYAALVGVLVFDSGAARSLVLVVVGLISVFAWIGAYRRWRLVSDMPTSKIRSAAQGYAELSGIAEPVGAEPLRDPVTHEPCVWFRVETYQAQTHRHKGVRRTQWILIKSAESSRPFVLRDDTGTCRVMPRAAEFALDPPLRVRDGSDLEHRVSRIRAGDPLHALGHFQTIHEPAGAAEAADIGTIVKVVQQRAAGIVSGWQASPASMERFDEDHNGDLDAAERKQMQVAAVREARTAMERERRATAVETNVMRVPADGRPYLISTRRARDAGAYYRNWAWVHLAFVLVGLVAAGWLAAS